jgi:hypothetical protein
MRQTLTRLSPIQSWYRAYGAPLALVVVALLCLLLPFFAALVLSISLLSAASLWAWTSFSLRRAIKSRRTFEKPSKGQLARVIPFPRERIYVDDGPSS